MSIFDNKPVFIPIWELKLVIEMGTYQDDVWVADQSIMPVDFEIWFDDTKLDLPGVVGEHRFNMPDTLMPIDHEIKMIISDPNWQHLIRCCVFIEDVDIGHITKHTGSYYTENVNYNKTDYDTDDIENVNYIKSDYGTDILSGIDSYQTIPIQTPIYRWLVNNREYVLSKISDKDVCK